MKALQSMIWLVVLITTGCVGTYGKVVDQSAKEELLTIQTLINGWEEYTVYFSARDGVRPAALLFDPKDDTTTLLGDMWIRIDEKETLYAIFNKVQVFAPNARVQKIIDPNGLAYGFIYFQTNLHVPVKMIDENTLYVMSLPQPISVR